MPLSAGEIEELLGELCARPPRSEPEFRYRIEPLREARAAALPLLLASLEREGAAHDLAAAALHEIAAPEDVPLLLAAFRDPERTAQTRAEIAQVLTGVAHDRLDELLEPAELSEVSRFSIDTLLERMRTGSGLHQVVEIFRNAATNERRALLAALGEATREPTASLRFGAVVEALFGAEDDEDLRAQMISALSYRAEPASARALARLRARAHRRERVRIEEALRRLERRGVRAAHGTPRSAWMSGADSTGSFNVGIAFPAALDLSDIVLACVNLEAGLRAVSLIASVEGETSGEIRRALEDGQGIPVAQLEVSTAFRLLHDACRTTLERGRPLPEGYAAIAPYLERPLALARRPSSAAHPGAVPRTLLGGLLDAPAYQSWVFNAAEIGTAYAVDLSTLAGGNDASSARRLRALARRVLGALEGTEVSTRLVRMLRHQAEVHRLRAEHALALRSEAAARDIEQQGLRKSPVALRMMERSLALHGAHGLRGARTEVREGLKRRLEASGAPSRREVFVLDLGEALYRQIENLNETLPPAERLTLAQMENQALAAAESAVREFTRDSAAQAALPGLERPAVASRPQVRRRLRATASVRAELAARLASETGLAASASERMATALTTVAAWFTDQICLERCRRGCPLEPGSDGRSLFYAAEHPAGIDLSSAEPRSDGAVPAASLEVQRYLARSLDEEILVTTAFLDALAALGFAQRGEDRTRRSRAERVLERLRESRLQLDRPEGDPGSIYSCVEETAALRRELSGLRRALFSAAVSRGGAADEKAEAEAVGAWHGLERELRRLGLVGVPRHALQPAVAALPSPTPLVALLRGAAWPCPARALRRLATRASEFWSQVALRDATGGARSEKPFDLRAPSG